MARPTLAQNAAPFSGAIYWAHGLMDRVAGKAEDAAMLPLMQEESSKPWAVHVCSFEMRVQAAACDIDGQAVCMLWLMRKKYILLKGNKMVIAERECTEVICPKLGIGQYASPGIS